jgi:TatD DNase family protein
LILTDTHAHLYEEAFDADRDAMIARAMEAGITKICIPNVDSTTITGMLQLCAQYPGQIFPMMGLHPCYVKPGSYQQELVTVKSYLDKEKFVAVGEIGIDLYWDKTTLDIQQEAFITQMDWAIEKNRPIAVHSRESLSELINICQARKDHLPKGVFHCFTGSFDEAVKLTDMGFYLGIGGVVTYKNTHLRDVLKRIPLDRIVLETDSPYLPPVPHRGKRNEPAYTKIVAETLSMIYQKPPEEIAAITTRNAGLLFGI